MRMQQCVYFTRYARSLSNILMIQVNFINGIMSFGFHKYGHTWDVRIHSK